MTTSPGLGSLPRPRPAGRPAVAAPPAAGPAWFGSVMGSGILSTLLHLHSDRIPGATAASEVLLVVAWALMTGLTLAFAARCVREPGELLSSITDAARAPMWGMVSMGVLSVGSATATVVPAAAPGLTGAAWGADAVLWTAGTVLGLVTAFGFTAKLARGSAGSPSFVWGLPVVPPMVSATTGAALAGRLASPGACLALLLVCVGCFFVALTLGVVLFAVAYHHTLRRDPLPLAAAASTWIPLGIVGQSTAAAQSLVGPSARLVTAEVAGSVAHAAHVYGAVVLVAGTPLFAWAAWSTVRGLVLRMPFAPGWWAMTFPVGTCALGAHLLGAGTGDAAVLDLGLVLCGVLVCTWTLCAVASVRAVLAAREGEAAESVAHPAPSTGSGAPAGFATRGRATTPHAPAPDLVGSHVI